MPDDFDPYYKWLAIPPEEQPPHHYRLLGVQPFEADTDVIASAADQRMAHLRTFQTGKHAAKSQQLLNEIAAARVCLLNPAKRAAYDQQLRPALQARTPAPPPAAPLAYARPAAPPPAAPPLRPSVPIPVHSPPVPPATAIAAVVTPALDEPGLLVATESPIRSSASRRKRKKSMVGLAIPAVLLGALAIIGTVVYWNNSHAPATQHGASSHHGHHPHHVESHTDDTKPPTDDKPANNHNAAPKHPEKPEKVEKPTPSKKPEPELQSAAAKKLLQRVAGHVSTGTVEHSERAGGDGGGRFGEIPSGGALLVGFNLSTGNYAGNTVLRGVQAMYLTPKGIVAGQPFGHSGHDPIKLLARPGFAVGAIRVRSGDRVDGLEAVFMRIRDQSLDPRDAYTSPWTGGTGGRVMLLTGEGRAAVGIFGGVGSELDGIGLVLDQEPFSPKSDMPADEPQPFATTPGSWPAKERLPVPSAEAQRDAQTLIHTLFKDDYADSSKGLQQRFALAQKLFHKAEETSDDPAARYMLICEVRDLAARCGNSQAVAESIILLANHYTIDDVGMTLSSFEKTAEVSSPPALKRRLVEDCLVLIDKAVEQEKYEVADQLGAIGKRAASKAQDIIVSQRLSWRLHKLREQKAAYDDVEKAFKTLKAQPADPAANLAVGRYRCLYQEDWRDGLPLLAKGSDPALKAVARQELGAPTDPEQQLKVAEAWDALAKADEKERALYERRAKFWYQRALVGLRGLNKAKVEKKVDELVGGRGLKAEYFRGDNLDAKEKVLTRVDPNIDFNWGRAGPDPAVPGEDFSARWTGLLVAPTQADYQLTADHDDGIRVWIDNKMVIDRWDKSGKDSGVVSLTSKKPRSIKIEYHNHGNARLILKWAQKSGFGEQVIPPEAFWQEHASGSKTFAPLPLPAYKESFVVALPEKNSTPDENE